ncbi:MAG TPA: DUF6220 domain-containing protein [Bacillales bacterium]|nr:DUF6220 domain-containing protein [Bacillales bacterium]
MSYENPERSVTNDGYDRAENGSGNHLSRFIYAFFAWLFFACVVVQVFLAGMATFGDASYWGKHMTFVHFFELVPIVLFILSFIGRLRGGLRWWPLILLALIYVQYITANIGKVVSTDFVAALHPVNALVIFWIAMVTAIRASKVR